MCDFNEKCDRKAKTTQYSMLAGNQRAPFCTGLSACNNALYTASQCIAHYDRLQITHKMACYS